ncbi:MAG: GSU2403 family nucleotidyltransferase fold protein [Desulfuromonadales bacterium]|nr:GSU2403 family nucleotidyltransferase fold protein [Desulfuromonadales bacterium]
MAQYKIEGDLGLPATILDLFQVLQRADFFMDGLLIGSWAILFYEEVLGIKYVLRTGDIDLALGPGIPKETKFFDLDAEFRALGMESVVDRETGLQKFLTDFYEVEFLIHRTGGRDEVKLVRKYNVNAQAMPFIDTLFIDPIEIEFAGGLIRIPQPEALFFQKLIVAQRRPQKWKKEKDLEQCGVLAGRLDLGVLKKISAGYRMSGKTLAMIRESCSAIGFDVASFTPNAHD